MFSDVLESVVSDWRLFHILYTHRVFLLYEFFWWKIRHDVCWRLFYSCCNHKVSLLCEFSEGEWHLRSEKSLSYVHCILWCLMICDFSTEGFLTFPAFIRFLSWVTAVMYNELSAWGRTLHIHHPSIMVVQRMVNSSSLCCSNPADSKETPVFRISPGLAHGRWHLSPVNEFFFNTWNIGP